jgi:hypothetical protein
MFLYLRLYIRLAVTEFLELFVICFVLLPVRVPTQHQTATWLMEHKQESMWMGASYLICRGSLEGATSSHAPTLPKYYVNSFHKHITCTTSFDLIRSSSGRDFNVAVLLFLVRFSKTWLKLVPNYCSTVFVQPYSCKAVPSFSVSWQTHHLHLLYRALVT